MGVTTVTYGNAQTGGVVLKNVMMRSWNESVVYDASNTDPIRHTYQLAFEAIVHAQSVTDAPASVSVIGSTDPSNAISHMERVRTILKEPRLDLHVACSGFTLLHIKSIAGGGGYISSSGILTDVDNGPKPTKVSIQQIISGRVFRIVFEVTCSVVECRDSGTLTILDNRWSVAESMDENFVLTRSIVGRLVAGPGTVSAQELRYYVFPFLESGFRRMGFAYEVTEDGRSVNYRITDQQVGMAAPSPATTITGSHVINTANESVVQETVDLTLTGPCGCSRVAMLARAFECANARINFLRTFGPEKDGGKKRTALVTNLTIAETFGSGPPSITLRIDVVRAVGIDYLKTVTADKTFGRDFKLPPLKTSEGSIGGTEYNAFRSQRPPPYGYDVGSRTERSYLVVALLDVLLQSPCSDYNKAINSTGVKTNDAANDSQNNATDTQLTSTEGNFDVYGSTVGELSEYILESSISTDPEILYTYYRMETTYTARRVAFNCPLGSDPTDEDSPSSVFIDTGARVGMLHIKIEAEAQEGSPKLPYIEDDPLEVGSGVTARLIDTDICWLSPVVDKAHSHTHHRVIAYWRLALNRPIRAKDQYVAVGLRPILSMETDSHLSSVQPVDIFVHTIFPGTS